MKVIFGGTFDPVHIGHLRMATELSEKLGVESVNLMPCYQAVHKDSVSASASDRLTMLRLATRNDKCLVVDDREIRRGEESYTIDSLHEIRGESPKQPLSIVMGTDSALSLSTWRSAEEFAALAHVVVVKRPGESSDALEKVVNCLQRLGFELAESKCDLKNACHGLALILELTQLDVSSTAIRNCVKENKSIRYLVKGAVEAYICDNGLYRS